MTQDTIEDQKTTSEDRPINAVRELILKPMLALYVPPQQVKFDLATRNRALAEYESILARFPRKTLSEAWEQVKATHELVVWPSPGTIAKACRDCVRRNNVPSEDEQRRMQAQEMAEVYTARYMKASHVAKLAKQQGWSGHLREYVLAASSVQAQLICQVSYIGWDSILTQGLGRFNDAAEAFAAYRKAIAKPVECKQIRVNVPKARVQSWQEHCRAWEPLEFESHERV